MPLFSSQVLLFYTCVIPFLLSKVFPSEFIKTLLHLPNIHVFQISTKVIQNVGYKLLCNCVVYKMHVLYHYQSIKQELQPILWSTKNLHRPYICFLNAMLEKEHQPKTGWVNLWKGSNAVYTLVYYIALMNTYCQTSGVRALILEH